MSDATPAPPEHVPPSAQSAGVVSPRSRSAGWQMVSDAFHSGISVAKARRARVLAQPDLAQMLCEPPLSLPTPHMWTGFIPPAQIPRHSETHPYKMNRSPIRNQLIEVCRLVAEREAAAAEVGDAE